MNYLQKVKQDNAVLIAKLRLLVAMNDINLTEIDKIRDQSQQYESDEFGEGVVDLANKIKQFVSHLDTIENEYEKYYTIIQFFSNDTEIKRLGELRKEKDKKWWQPWK